MRDTTNLQRLSPVLWEISPGYKDGMKVPARVYASEKIFSELDKGVFEQITNVASLPGIVKYALCMPDGHHGYGFPIGGVAAFDPDQGVISPGGVGFDINCGVRLVRTNLTVDEVEPKLGKLLDLLFKIIPSGVGSEGMIRLSKKELNEILAKGISWCLQKGYGWPEDIEYIEERGRIKGANPDTVSSKAAERGLKQLGTLGSGNHYLEIQKVNRIFNQQVARVFGLEKEGQITIMVHCGSRGFGHQIGTDYLRLFSQLMPKYGLKVLDRELTCAPYVSPEGQRYYGAMACGANLAFANRQVIVHRIREGFSRIFKKDARTMGLKTVYDVAHNIAKLEEQEVDGKKVKLLVHRKGSTRSFGPGRQEIPENYRQVGQPVLLGGSMETSSYLLVGTAKAYQETFGSTSHGSGRTMSRTKARKQIRGQDLQEKMAQAGIKVMTSSYSDLAEEGGFAYKDVDEVVETIHQAGISLKVAELKPLANIKG